MYEVCPICNKQLDKSHLSSLKESILPEYSNLECKNEDHSFFTMSVGDEPILLKIKFIAEDKKKIFLKLDYRDKIGYIWTKPNDPKPRKVPLFNLDFSNIPKLKQKLKTLLIFV